jgi:drug/metabolite transporter (DMT)-like permease
MRVGVGFFPIVTFTAIRLAVALIAFFALLAATGRQMRWERRFLVRVVPLGILSVAFPSITVALALRLISSTFASILLNLAPVFSAILAHLLLPDERLTWLLVVGVALAVAGASAVVWASSDTRGAEHAAPAVWLGVSFVVAAALSIAYASILARRLGTEDALVVTGGQMLASFAVVMPLALIVEGPRVRYLAPWQGWAGLIWSGLIGVFLGNAVRYTMIRRFGVTFAATSRTAVPLFAALTGILLLDETVTPLMIIGGLVLIAGVVVANRASIAA